MQALHLDYVRGKTSGAWVRWALLALAVGFSADIATTYVALREDVADKEARLARLPNSGTESQSSRAAAAPFTESEFLAARDTIRRIATPWEALFEALESARTDGAALLSIEPDSQGGAVLLTGEARDYLEVLNYASALSAAKTLKSVHLVRHETRQNDAQRPIAFVISARWGE